eukprot:TRINITY_DN59098_c0_g1_i1.p1 TRINITY_DN59098_c0_g1~~TRINITY_DN59098_c0_g1_i1.p1  ORF type:complete len:695 (+),score=104.10 TRINITY_DN59098_c0_g1_i1:162-2246(+)
MAQPPSQEHQVVPESTSTAQKSVRGGRAGALPTSVFAGQQVTANVPPASIGGLFPTQPWGGLHEPMVSQGFSIDWSQLPRDLRPSELREVRPATGHGFVPTGDQILQHRWQRPGEAPFAELPLLELSRAGEESEPLSSTHEGQLALEIELLERQLQAELAWASAQGTRQISLQSLLPVVDPILPSDIRGPSQASSAWNRPSTPSQPFREPVVPQGILPQPPTVHNDDIDHRPGAGRVLAEIWQLDHNRQHPDTRSQTTHALAHQPDHNRHRPDSRSQTTHAFAQFSRSEFRHFKITQRSAVLTIQTKIHSFHAKKFVSQLRVSLIQRCCRSFLAKSYLTNEEGRRWESALQQVRRQASLRICAKCKVWLARQMLRSLQARAAAKLLRGSFSSYLARRQLAPQFQGRRAARFIQSRCRTFLAQKFMLADLKRLVLSSQMQVKLQVREAKDYLLNIQAHQSARDTLLRRQQVRQSALVIQRACHVFLSRQRLLWVQQAKKLELQKLRAVVSLQTMLEGVTAKHRLAELSRGPDQPPKRQPRSILQEEHDFPTRALERRVQDAWEVVLNQQQEHARMEEEVSRLKRVQEQEQLDGTALSCFQCDQNMLLLDAYLRALKRINSTTIAGADRPSSSSSGMGNDRFLLAKIAAALTSVVNEIEEAGGKVEHQLKELAAYLSWVSVNSFATPPSLEKSLRR